MERLSLSALAKLVVLPKGVAAVAVEARRTLAASAKPLADAMRQLNGRLK